MNKANVLILGANGLLGNTIFKYLYIRKKYEVYGSFKDKKRFKLKNNLITGDIIKNNKLNLKKIINFIKKKNIKFVINCLGITKHKKIKNKELHSYLLNSKINFEIINNCKNIKLVILSSDCVFNGKKGCYIERATPNANDTYGKSKAKGEIKNNKKVITLRTSTIGHEIKTKYGLLEWFLSQKKIVKGYSKAFFSGPTSLELAKVIDSYILTNKLRYGIYHISAKKISKYNLLKKVSFVYNKKIKIIKDNNFSIDRSLNSNKFKNQSKYKFPSWIKMIKDLKQFNEQKIF